MPVPLKAQCQISSSWTLTEYKSTVHSLNIHVYSIIFQTPILRGAAHVSGSFSSSSQLKSKALSTVCKALCFRTSPPSSPHSFCLGYSDLLKLSKPPALCLEGIFLKLGLGSPPLSLQVSAPRVPYPRGFPTPSYMKHPPDPGIILHLLPCSVFLCST